MTKPSPIRLAVIGLGKIARDQHLPAIAGDDRFELVATVDPQSSGEGVATFASLDEEVQLLGAAAAGLVPADALLCQPGTHCKWLS